MWHGPCNLQEMCQLRFLPVDAYGMGFAIARGVPGGELPRRGCPGRAACHGVASELGVPVRSATLWDRAGGAREAATDAGLRGDATLWYRNWEFRWAELRVPVPRGDTQPVVVSTLWYTTRWGSGGVRCGMGLAIPRVGASRSHARPGGPATQEARP